VKYKKADDTVEDLQEHLIPELCSRINFPALYWLKATTLPTILHRISQLLIAEDLRKIIAQETGLGTTSKISSLQKWPSLTLEDIQKGREEESNNEMDLADDSIEKTQPNQPDMSEVGM